MTEYTPVTQQVKDAYVRAMRAAFIASTGEHREEFDRWLNEIRAEAWDEGFRIGGNGFIPFAVNPYRPIEK